MENLLLDVAEKSGTKFRLGSVTAPAVSAMRSKDVTRDLLSVGTITLNIASPGCMENMDLMDGEKLMAIIFDYAMEVSPRDPSDENVINVAGLSDHAKFLRDTFGDIDISPDVIARIGQFAQMRINLQNMTAAKEPDRSREERA